VTLREKKTGTLVNIPLDPRLVETMAASVCGIANTRSQSGTPYSERIWQCTPQMVRRSPSDARSEDARAALEAWCRHAAEAGLSEVLIMAMSGHKTSREVQR
jgi:hypothetical protein